MGMEQKVYEPGKIHRNQRKTVDQEIKQEAKTQSAKAHVACNKNMYYQVKPYKKHRRCFKVEQNLGQENGKMFVHIASYGYIC